MRSRFLPRVRLAGRLPTALALLAGLTPALPLRAALVPSEESQLDTLLAQMTLAEKIGQLTMVMENQLIAGEVREHLLGSVLLGPGRNFHPGLDTPVDWADHNDAFQAEAAQTRLAIPALVACDAIHGHALALGATVFPHNIGLGAARDAALTGRIGQVVARETAATGVDWVLGPCVAVTRDPRWGRTYEGWGEHPAIQTGLTGAFLDALQAPYGAGGDRMVATAKHYLADGGPVWGTGANGQIDQGDVQLDEPTLRRLHLPPYAEAVRHGVGSIMASYGKWQGVELHHHAYLLTDLLKTELGFEGFVVSDFNGFLDGDDPPMKPNVQSALLAGVDVFMLGERWREFATALHELVQGGQVPIARVDDAVRRLLRIKLRHGVFAQPRTDRVVTTGGTFGSAAHRDVAREAVRRSLVLLRNRGSLLPLDPGSRILVAGAKADDVGVQCGGWTVEWGGLSGSEANQVIPGTTVWEGVRDRVAAAGGTATYSATGAGAAGHDVAVVVVGENPYAEFQGDNGVLGLEAGERQLIRTIRAAGVPVVVVLVAARPLMFAAEIDRWDALVMAWLPGTEGDGVAQALFGEFPFTGRLPLTWPRAASLLPLNFDQPEGYDPLFPRGFGLSTGSGLAITTEKLPRAVVGEGYEVALAARGATGPLVWSVAEGSLPDGITLTTDGRLHGAAGVAGQFPLVLRASLADGATAEQAFVLGARAGLSYAAWAAPRAWPDELARAPGSDPDGDHLANLVEFFLDSDPLQPSPEDGPRVASEKTSGSRYVTIHYRQRMDTALLTGVCEVSSDLRTWEVSIATPTKVSETTTHAVWKIRQRLSGATNYHFRLRVTEE